MPQRALLRTQELTIIAQDPSVRINDRILTTQVSIPAEELAPGPRGYRVQVIDYNSSTGDLYPPLEYRILENGAYNDPFKDESNQILLEDPQFHAQNVYAIIMRTLARFESALGRRVGWGFQGHQLQVAPHAFADANAFYSKEDRALMFGYFPKSAGDLLLDDGKDETDGESGGSKRRDMVFTCLSHDVIVHETTHALLDGLRGRYTDPSSPEQAGFHEGFADIVALLSIFSLPRVVGMVIDKNFLESQTRKGRKVTEEPELIDVQALTIDELRKSLLLGLAEEVGHETNSSAADTTPEISQVRKHALRRSVELTPEIYHENLQSDTNTYDESHNRGEVLVAAVMNAFLEVWVKRLKSLGSKTSRAERALLERTATDSTPDDSDRKKRTDKEYIGFLNRARVVEEGAGVADYLLTMVIRALDYSPPTDLEFCDFLSAMLTADREIRPDDSKYQFRKILRESFKAYDIVPTSKVSGPEPGVWEPPECALRYDRIRLNSMMRDLDEMFRFIWENRKELGLEQDAYTRVISVRPSVRINPEDGFVLRETVAEYYQLIRLLAGEVKHLGIKIPEGMRSDLEITLYGGAALVFDEFGQLKFNVRNRLLNPERQTKRLQHLWRSEGEQAFEREDASERRFAELHRLRYGISPIDLETEGAWEDDYDKKDLKDKDQQQPATNHPQYLSPEQGNTP